MALSDPYADVASYRAENGMVDSADDATILRDLTMVSRTVIDRTLGRFFAQEGSVDTPVTCEYDANCPLTGYRPLDWAESENPYRWGGYSRSLEIDDFVTVAEVVVDEDMDGVCERTLGASEYELYPKNAALGPEPMPYKEIRIPSWSTFFGFRHGMRVHVSGVRGWPAVPAAIVSATIQYTALWRLESPRATTEVTELGTSRATSKRAQDILQRIPAHYSRRRVL